MTNTLDTGSNWLYQMCKEKHFDFFFNACIVFQLKVWTQAQQKYNMIKDLLFYLTTKQKQT